MTNLEQWKDSFKYHISTHQFDGKETFGSLRRRGIGGEQCELFQRRDRQDNRSWKELSTDPEDWGIEVAKYRSRLKGIDFMDLLESIEKIFKCNNNAARVWDEWPSPSQGLMIITTTC